MSLADRVFAWLLPLCCALLVGCQGGDPQPVPVSGVVRLNGKPLDHGEVMFIPDDTERGRSGRGQIGADGKYALMTFAPKDGVLPGSYTVAVSCYELSEKLGVPAVPERYLDPKKSPLRAEVGYFATVVNLELEGEVDSGQSMMGRN